MIQFLFNHLSVRQFALLGNALSDIKEQQVEVRFGCNVPKRTVTILLTIRMKGKDATPVLVLETENSFSISEESFLPLKKEEGYVIPRSLIVHFLVHAYGAARGILFCKTENTPFAGFILPPANVDAIVKEDLTVQ